jgi:nucleoside-diphosphate-sugar epimerase
MNILVTGGLGHIGSSLIRKLEFSKKTHIFVCDSLLTQRYSSIFHIPDDQNVRFFKMETQRITTKFLSAYEISAVIHLAAMTDATGSFERRDELFKNNLGGTQQLANSCGEMNVPIIFPSSTSVYGYNESLLTEESITNPQSPYAECKLREEEYLLSASEQGLQCTILRFGTIHGVSQGMRFHTAINKFCFQAVLGEPITVWETALNQMRPYLALSDATRAIQHVLNLNLFNGEVYNVLTNNHSVAEIISEIKEILRNNLRIDFVENQIMNQLSYEVSNEKFIKSGFSFTGSLSDDIEQTINLLRGVGIRG